MIIIVIAGGPEKIHVTSDEFTIIWGIATGLLICLFLWGCFDHVFPLIAEEEDNVSVPSSVSAVSGHD
jgi:hypothetical protein